MNYLVHPAALDELMQASSFYAAQTSAQLGHALISEFERVAAMLLANPELGMKSAAKTRRVVMRRFPFSVVYRVFGDHVYIIAITHHKRRPGYWRSRKVV